jgi:hypothetical protein
MARFPATTAVPPGYPFILERQESLPEERSRGIPVYIRMEEPGRFRDATLRWFGLGSPCGPRGSSEYTQRAGVSGGVRQLQWCDPGDHGGNSLPNTLRLLLFAKLRKTLNPFLVTMLQAALHAIHFNRILSFGEGQVGDLHKRLQVG